MTDEALVEAHALCIRAATRVYTKLMANLIYKDSHHWSTRPCGTCQTITAIVGEPFGCDRYRKEQAARKT